MRKIYQFALVALLVIATSGVWAQYMSVTSVPPLNAGNGQTGITFNVTAINAVTLKDFGVMLQATGSTTYEIWYNTTPISGPPTITTGTGWVMLASGNANGLGVGSVADLNSNISLEMPAGETYGFYIGSGGSVSYTNGGTFPEVYADANLSFNTGNNVGYGGPAPNPTFHIRQFNGTVYYELTSTAPNDAGITDIISPGTFCQNDSAELTVKLKNYGTEQLDSCQITWVVNGNSTTDWFIVNLDTNGGTGPTDTVLTIDNLIMNGSTSISVFSSLPNNIADTVNLNDTAYYAGGPALNGTYTLGSSASADFNSFTQFADSLNLVGVCGPVVVNVENGEYVEGIEFANLASMNSTNTVTIQSANQNSALVKLTDTLGVTLKMNGASYFTFKDITFDNTEIGNSSYTLEVSGNANYNSFENCVFDCNDSTSTSTLNALVYSNGASASNNTFINNVFNHGSYNIYWYGSGTASLSQNNTFEGNTFKNAYYRGCYFGYQDNWIFRNNTIYSNASYTSAYGIYSYYARNYDFSSNHIYSTQASSWPYIGAYLSSCSATSLNNPSICANNIIAIGDSNNTSTTYYGLYLTTVSVTNTVHNTSIVNGGGTSARALYYASSNLGTLANNIFVNYGSGYAVYNTNSTPLLQDNNVYHSEGGTLLYIDGAYNTLSNWQNSNSNFDQNSLEMTPVFSDTVAAIHCTPEINNSGIAISNVNTDFSGANRDLNTPDPGAREYYGLGSLDFGPDTTLCQGTFELSISDTSLINSVTWNANGNISNDPYYLVEALNGAEQFTVSASINSVCGTSSDTINVLLVPSAILDDSIHLCAGDTISLNSNSGSTATVTWFPGGETTSAITVSTPGYYSVSKSEFGCVSSANSIVSQSEAVDVLDIEPCNADLPAFISVAIAGGTSYSWSGGNAPNDATNSFDASGAYAVTATDVFGCVSSDSFSVTVIDVPTSAISQTHAGTYYYFSSANSSNVGSDASYLWQFGDGGTSTLANPEHNYNWGNPSSPPVYTVTLSITNDCGTNSTTKSYTIDVLGVETTENNLGYNVYPNPTSGVWNVSFAEGVESVSIEVIDIAGRIVLTSEKAHSTLIQVDGSNLPNGNYILKVTSNNETAYSRVAVAK
jgi:parallel beta-helix repeat protein